MRSRRRRPWSSGRRTSSRACTRRLISCRPRSPLESVRSSRSGQRPTRANGYASADPKTVLCAFFKANRCQKGEFMRFDSFLAAES